MTVEGFPSRLNEFGVAQLFGELTITGVTLRGKSATVVFANKFQAYQACEIYSNMVCFLIDIEHLHFQAIDRRHTLKITPLSEEVLSVLLQAAAVN